MRIANENESGWISSSSTVAFTFHLSLCIMIQIGIALKYNSFQQDYHGFVVNFIPSDAMF